MTVLSEGEIQDFLRPLADARRDLEIVKQQVRGEPDAAVLGMRVVSETLGTLAAHLEEALT